MQNICSRATIVFLILFSTSDVFAASLQTVGECGKQTAMTKNGALLVGYPFCAADIACALQEPIGASACAISCGLMGFMPRAFAEWARSTWRESGPAIQISQVSFRYAAAIVRERTGSRVVHVERYGDVYYVTVSTSDGNETHCVHVGTGEYLGRC